MTSLEVLDGSNRALISHLVLTLKFQEEQRKQRKLTSFLYASCYKLRDSRSVPVWIVFLLSMLASLLCCSVQYVPSSTFFFRRHIGTSEKQHMLAEKENLEGLADTCDFWASVGFSNYKLFRCCGLDRIYSKLVVSLLFFTDLESLMNAMCTSPDALF